MARYDVVVIGSGLGGLTAAALLAHAGRKVLVLERNHSIGGAASAYKVGDLMVEASLHETADPHSPFDSKHAILTKLGILDAVEWVPVGSFFEVRGGPVGEPFVLPDNFADARSALDARFPSAKAGTARVLREMDRIVTSVGTLDSGRNAFGTARSTMQVFGGLPAIARGWRRSLSDVFTRAFDGNEAVKCALAPNIGYYHDDPDTLSWVFFALAQGSFFKNGACYIKGSSHRLSHALARVIRNAGGEIALRRQAKEIRLDRDGKPAAVVHEDSKGGDRREDEAAVVVANTAPTMIADMLPEPATRTFHAAYGAAPSSTSLFALTLGLSAPPATFGIKAYSTFLLPSWMQRLADFKRNTDLLADMPNGQAPLIAVVDYSAIDSGLGGPPYPVSVVGVDRVANWQGMDAATYADKRQRWQDAIVGTIDAAFPGFASHVTASIFNTARSMQGFLGTPHGAVYGFAPTPPAGPFWRGTTRSPQTPVPGLYLASAYAGSGGFGGAMRAGRAAADLILSGT